MADPTSLDAEQQVLRGRDRPRAGAAAHAAQQHQDPPLARAARADERARGPARRAPAGRPDRGVAPLVRLTHSADRVPLGRPVGGGPGQRRPVPNIPRAISAAAVRMNCRKAPDFTTCVTTPSSSLVRRRDEVEDFPASFAASLASAFAWSAAAFSAAALAAPVLELLGEHLAGRLAVDDGGVLGVPRAGRDGGLHRLGGGRRHQRLGRPQPGPGDRRRGAALAHDGDDRLADAQGRDDLAEVVVRRVGVGVDGRLERLGVVGGVRAERVLDPRAELGEDLVGDVGRALGHEEDADALGPDQPHGLGDLRRGTPSRRR